MTPLPFSLLRLPRHLKNFSNLMNGVTVGPGRIKCSLGCSKISRVPTTVGSRVRSTDDSRFKVSEEASTQSRTTT